MPRPKKPGVEPKRRSRNGCWPCKSRKVKCGEEKPGCSNCERQGEKCDYSIRLNWGGRTKRDSSVTGVGILSTASGSPYQAALTFDGDASPLFPPTPETTLRPSMHARSRSNISPPRSSNFMVDPELMQMSQSQTPPAAHSTSSFDYFNGVSVMSTAAPFSQTQFQTAFDFPPVPAADFGSFEYSTTDFGAINVEAPLPQHALAPPRGSIESLYRHSPAPSMSDVHSPFTGPPSPYSPFMAMPLTPNSSVGSDESIFSKQQNIVYPPPDLRRMSVLSIINNDTEHSQQGQLNRRYPVADFASTTYGYDLGRPDMDSPNNDDFAAISIFSPQSNTMEIEDDHTDSHHGNTNERDNAFESGGYYVKPVPICIPKSLEPLPPILKENPMNLMYFHHFINHTARILVPHDCDINPFRFILPDMAVKDEYIMNLLLAYSAAHRARMLNHPEPANRIAVWVQHVFPKLRQTLTESPNDVSDNTLAAVIMMASLEIISSGTFEVPISWQDHLSMARQMIVTRGGPREMAHQGHVANFLSRWFSYLDILGSLSGNKNAIPLGSAYWLNENSPADEDFQLDCLMGFTTRCVGSLARISELARMCQAQRIDEDGNLRESWQPGPEVVQQAVQIRREIEEGLLERNIHKGCNHRPSTPAESEGAWNATEIYATNELFHWAGLIHLYRRVLGKPAVDIEVQHAIREIAGLLNKIRRGSTAEACLIFPLFAAGCDAQDESQRKNIMDRLKSVEGFGMTHTPKVASLLQCVWDTGKPWESLASGEFFG